jgi:carboxypeptidase D
MIKNINLIFLSFISSSLLLIASHPANYHNFNETVEQLQSFVTNYPNLCHLESIGESGQGRKIWALKISDNVTEDENEPTVTLNATIHGDESIANEISLKLIAFILEEYKNNSPTITNLVNHTQLYFLPIINPDGMVNTRRENANGADLNRSFPDGVEENIQNIFDRPTFSTVGRQPETAVLMRWHAQKNFALSACLHSGTVLIVYPYGNNPEGTNHYTACPDDALLIEISQNYIAGNPSMDTSMIKNAAVMYPVTGEMADWKYRFLGTLTTTIELSDTKEPTDIDSVWQNHKQALINYLSSGLQGLHGTVIDASTGNPINAKLSLINQSGHDFYTGNRGYYNRILSAGDYEVLIEAQGFQAKQINVTINEAQLNYQTISLDPTSESKKLEIGWNQLSLAWPISQEVEEDLLKEQQKVWIWQGDFYQRSEIPMPGIAFWLYSNEERTVVFDKKPSDFLFTPPSIRTGWNLIGYCSFCPIDEVYPSHWGWTWHQSNYDSSSTMKRWNGYWVFSLN